MEINLTMSQWNLLNSGKITTSFNSLDINNDNKLTHADAKAATDEKIKNEILQLLKEQDKDEEVKTFDLDELNTMLMQAESKKDDDWKTEIQKQIDGFKTQVKLAQLEVKQKKALEKGDDVWLASISSQITKIINDNKITTLNNILQTSGNLSESQKNEINEGIEMLEVDSNLNELYAKLDRAYAKNDKKWIDEIKKQIDEICDSLDLKQLQVKLQRAKDTKNTKWEAEIQKRIDEITNNADE